MNEDKGFQNKGWALGALAIVVIGGAAFYLRPAPVPEVAPQVAVAAPAPVQAPVEAEATAPVFDTFRLDPDGGMVVAGRAAPGQVVELILADEVIASAEADASGSFVMLTEAGPSDAPRRLSLLADPAGAALPSQGSYLVAPITAPVAIAEAAPAIAEAAPAIADVDDQPVDVLAEIAAPAPAPATTPVVVQADPEGLRIVQGAPALPAPNVVLDAITYDPDGTLQLAGRATGSGQVQIYLDDQPISTAPVLEGRDWRIDLPDVATGIYTLRIDEVDASGAVVSRLETPFQREAAANVAAAMADDTSEDGFEVAIRTVQPGSTLWAIAEETLGSGIFYVQVFEANSDLIRDPDLIYPGQIFRIPDPAE
ncbi:MULTISPECIES: LysM peptidoglycan-binding domain-containing protein [unclassified Yoonia]|uniref:LysM peptidoglycan-binding domain-containing protein n=1 Tax=unclassified Yoonia TaxID=2629118 RepID=UPI002B002D5B|nr:MULTISPECIES: LysM peptidoglycan-binding domain-containing protein [unclassified Yoonia]